MSIRSLAASQRADAILTPRTADAIRRDQSVAAIARTAFLEMPPSILVSFLREYQDVNAALEVLHLIRDLERKQSERLFSSMFRVLVSEVKQIIYFHDWKGLRLVLKMAMSGTVAIPLWHFKQRPLRKRLAQWRTSRQEDLIRVIGEHGSREELRSILCCGKYCFSNQERVFLERMLAAR